MGSDGDGESQTHSESDVAERVIGELSSDERQKLRVWLEELLEIRKSEASVIGKLGLLRSSLRHSRSLFPVIRVLYSKLKEQVWDRRSDNGRWFIGASAVGIGLFGLQGAGLAALGGAIGLPLFIVFGGGVTLAKLLIDEIRRRDGDD